MKEKVSISVPGIQPKSARHSSGGKKFQWQLKKKKKKETSKVIERNIRNENPKMRLKGAAHILIHW